ncbi:MAG: LacI family DNA-binding transcriptional regulator [Enterococcus sp.]
MSSIREVAKRAGVSIGSVSRYLNGQKLKETNMQKIAAAIDDLDYKENIIAKGLKNNRSFSIGLLMNNLSSRLSSDIVKSIEELMETNGYSMILSCFDGNSQLVGQKLDYLLSHSVDGLILFEADENWPGMEKLADLTIPIISLNTPNHLSNVDSILVDDRGSVYQAIQSIIQSDHKSIGIIAAPQTDYVACERLGGAYDAIEGTTSNLLTYKGDYSRLSGYLGAKSLIEQGVTALFVCNYNMSIGALEYFNQVQLHVGTDIYFAHYDYSNELQKMGASRMTIEQPAAMIGRLCGERLLEKMYENESSHGELLVLENKICGINDETGRQK